MDKHQNPTHPHHQPMFPTNQAVPVPVAPSVNLISFYGNGTKGKLVKILKL